MSTLISSLLFVVCIGNYIIGILILTMLRKRVSVAPETRLHSGSVALKISGVSVGSYEPLDSRPRDDKERAIWYEGYRCGRRDEAKCVVAPTAMELDEDCVEPEQ